jgi:phenylpropionate dioxygenase-like ring-hydroxylating dioxygenase large terminal subunit
LFFGRNEENGLRCVYHGWKFDVDGSCVDLPNAPEGPTFKDKIKIKCYPIVEAGQILWVYMGPADKRPPFPELEWTDFPASHIYATKFRLECNYLQAMEGDFDQTHARFLHSTLDSSGSKSAPDEPFPVAVGSRRVSEIPWTDLRESETGMWMITAGSDAAGKSFASAHAAWLMPVFSQIGLSGPNTNGINMRVPIDNASAFLYRIRWAYNPIPEEEIADYKYSGYSYPELIPGTWTPKDNISNDYNVDRVAQKNFSYTGIRAFPTQDVALIENQRGPIQDRTLEHLTSSDGQVIFIRRKLMAMATALQAGQEPSEPWQPRGLQIPPRSRHRRRDKRRGDRRGNCTRQDSPVRGPPQCSHRAADTSRGQRRRPHLDVGRAPSGPGPAVLTSLRQLFRGSHPLGMASFIRA